MSIESDGSNERLLITRAPTLDVPIVRTPFEVPTPVEPLPRIDSGLWTLTAWEKMTLAIDDGIEKTKFVMALMPHLFTIWSGIMFKNWKTTLLGIGGLIGVVIKAIVEGTITPQTITEGLIAIGLIFAKDSNVTGGTTQP